VLDGVAKVAKIRHTSNSEIIMIKIGKINLGRIPRVAVTVTDREGDKLNRPLLIDIIEIRVDQFRSTDPIYIKNVIKKMKRIGAPLILTVRSKDEGGQRDIPDKLKLNIFKDNISLVDAVDIELRSPILPEVVKNARKNGKKVIISWHNLKMTPADKKLKDILDQAKRSGANIVKIAAKANNTADLNRLMKFTIENRSKNIITISLGGIGSLSRLVFPGLGSLITYAYINKPSGSGQISLDVLRSHLQIYYPQYNSQYSKIR